MAELENILIVMQKYEDEKYNICISKSNWPIFERQNVFEKENFENGKSRFVAVFQNSKKL